jgi:glycosyltransferase involved in cell wall biosynthesis
MQMSVIIPTYNRANSLRVTLQSLLEQDLSPASYEIIVVDNNSSDHTVAVVREIRQSGVVDVRYLHEARPGVHYARNLGATQAQGTILYFTDDDMVADRRMLSELLIPFAFDPRIAVVTGRVLPKWESDPPAWVKKHCANTLLSLQLRSEDLIISNEDPGVWSCHEAIRKDVLLECGGFNPENTEGRWVGDGETGLNLKVQARGYKFAFTGKSVTHHVIPAARMTQRYLNKRLENQGNADVFTWYRRERPDDLRLAKAQLTSILNCGLEMLAGVSNFVTRNDAWRMHRARLNYFRARFAYCRRLRRDPTWRAFVLKDNWMQPESERIASYAS